MASELFNARSDFSNFGSSLASIQQNALDDQMSNNAALQNYNNATAQLKASIPSSFGETIFGAYEFLGQGKDLLARLSKVKSDIAAAPDAIKASLVKGGNKLGASLEEGKNLLTTTAGELKQTATELSTKATDITNRGVNAVSETAGEIKGAAADLGSQLQEKVAEGISRRIPPPAPTAEALQKSLTVPELPKFTLPETIKRPTSLGLADTTAPENIRQQAVRLIDPEQAQVAANAILKPTQQLSEEILPTRLGGLQEAASSSLANLSQGAKGAQQTVTTSLESATQKGGALANEAVTTASETAGKVTSTLSEAANVGGGIAKAATEGIAETTAEVASSVLPIVGEVTAIGLGAVQIYEGFKDLFDHPSIAKPVSVPLPTVANIGQGFQSGI